MNTNLTDITVVLDRSGSMGIVAADTIGGYNQFLGDQRQAPGSCIWTLYQFDDQFDTVTDARPITEARELTSETFKPRGSTALLDAIGFAITNTGKRLAAMAEAERPGKVIVVILTDGQENASRKFHRQKINDMITLQRDTYKWEFIFLGANQDAISTAAAMGVSAGSSMTYASNTVGTQSLFRSVSDKVGKFRTGQTVNCAFDAEDREEQVKAGAAPDSITSQLPTT